MDALRGSYRRKQCSNSLTSLPVIFKSVYTLCCLCIFTLSGFGQLRWKLVSQPGLPSSIRLYSATDSLNGRPFIGYYLEASLNNKKLEFTTQVAGGKRYTPLQFYSKED